MSRCIGIFFIFLMFAFGVTCSTQSYSTNEEVYLSNKSSTKIYSANNEVLTRLDFEIETIEYFGEGRLEIWSEGQQIFWGAIEFNSPSKETHTKLQISRIGEFYLDTGLLLNFIAENKTSYVKARIRHNL